jgi:hypothetical protein
LSQRKALDETSFLQLVLSDALVEDAGVAWRL